MSKPVGSGYFAAVGGVVLLAVFIFSYFVSIDKLPPEWILRTWLLFVAVILITWGVRRVAKGNKQDFTIGQETINFVIGVLGATFVLMALLNDVSERKGARPTPSLNRTDTALSRGPAG
jgi:high-affinity Fe2+/Pb2+ permease